jgi:hypothetical protein
MVLHNSTHVSLVFEDGKFAVQRFMPFFRTEYTAYITALAAYYEYASKEKCYA